MTCTTGRTSRPRLAKTDSVNYLWTARTQRHKIRYTLDGSTPDASSKLWTGEPVRISEKSVVKAAAFVGGHQVSYLREAEIVPGEDLVFWYPFNN